MVSFDLRDSVAFVRLARPEKQDALWAELGESFESLRRVTAVRAVILTGADESAFCVGADRAELAGAGAEEARLLRERWREVCALVEGSGVPVIAAINGLAKGGGFELALSCHIRIASTEARLSLSEVESGSPAVYFQYQSLNRTATGGRTIEVMLAGGQISAQEALGCGLVNRVVAPAQLLAEAESLASEISRHAPLAIRACLAAVTRGLRLPLAEGLELETELFSALFTTEDMREGASAFLEKRAPVFKGK